MSAASIAGKYVAIVRTRDPAELKKCVIVLDVGHVYDFDSGRFDHHQPDFEETLDEDHRTPLSSCGLVYKHFGHELLRVTVGAKLTDEQLETLFFKMYRQFIEHIDGNDNGLLMASVRLNYSPSTMLPGRVGSLNGCDWLGTKDSMCAAECPTEGQNARFIRAMMLCMSEFLPKSFYAARKMTAVQGQLDAVMAKRERPEVLVLDDYFPWSSELFKHAQGGEVQFVIHPSTDHKSFNLRTVDKDITNRMAGKRCEFPEAWAGLNDAALDEATADAVPAGCVFCHRGRFIAGHRTLAGAKAMAAEALVSQTGGGTKYQVVETFEPKQVPPPASAALKSAAKQAATGDGPPVRKKTKCVAGKPTFSDVQSDILRMTANLVQLSGKIGGLAVLHDNTASR